MVLSSLDADILANISLGHRISGLAGEDPREMILCVPLSLSPCPFPDALTMQPCRLFSLPSHYAFYPRELLILLFIPLEHLHINPFFLSRCCLWSERFAVPLGAQMVSGGVLEMKIRGSSGLHEVLILMQNSQSRGFLFS